MSSSMREVLAQVAARFATAIVTGRSVEKVRAFVGLESLVYAGSHGLDIRLQGGGAAEAKHIVAPEARPTLEAAMTALKRQLCDIEGATVEDNNLTVSVHYRHVAEERRREVEAAVEAVVTEMPDLVKTPGLLVWELRPAVDWGKGHALVFLLKTLELDHDGVLPVYIGDDVSDEDAFRKLRDLGRGVGVCVGAPTRDTDAHYRLRDVKNVEEFLRALLELHDHRGEGSAGLRPAVAAGAPVLVGKAVSSGAGSGGAGPMR